MNIDIDQEAFESMIERMSTIQCEPDDLRMGCLFLLE